MIMDQAATIRNERTKLLANALNTAGKLMKGAEPVAKALKAQFDKAGIAPIWARALPPQMTDLKNAARCG